MNKTVKQSGHHEPSKKAMIVKNPAFFRVEIFSGFFSSGNFSQLFCWVSGTL
jgi:hypothetical protein